MASCSLLKALSASDLGLMEYQVSWPQKSYITSLIACSSQTSLNVSNVGIMGVLNPGKYLQCVISEKNIMNLAFCSLKHEKSLLCLCYTFRFPSQVRPLWQNLWGILWGPLFCCPLPSACPPSGPALIKSRPSSVEPSTLWGTTSQRNKSSRRAWRHLSLLTGRNSWDVTGVVKFSGDMACFVTDTTQSFHRNLEL